MTNLKGWGTYDDEAAAREKQEAADETTRNSILAPDENGRHRYRILPPFSHEKGLFVRAYRHFIQWPGMRAQIRTNCPRVPTKGQQPCPFCKKGFELYGSDNEVDKKVGKDLLPRMNAYCRAIDRENPDKGVQVLRLPKSVFDALQDIRNDPEDPTRFTDVNEGYDVWIDRSGKGIEVEYKTRLAPKPTPLTEDSDEADKWLEEAQNIDVESYGRLPSSAELKQLMADAMGQAGDGGSLPSGDASGGALPENAGGRGRRRDAMGDFDPDADGDDGDGFP